MRKTGILFSLFLSLALMASLLVMSGCGGSDSEEEEDNGGNTEATFKVTGSLTGASSAAEAAAAATFSSYSLYAEPDYAPDSMQSTEAVSATLSPEAYTVALKRLTLLGDEDSGTADYTVFSGASVDDAYIADFVNDTTFFDSETFPDAGTYTGIEIEVFYIEMDVEVYIPRLSYESDNSTYTFTSDVYTMRGYFDEVGEIEPRDVTVFWDDPNDDPDGGEMEYWIDRQRDHAEPFGVVSVDNEERPMQTFDLWADEVFWGREDITIATTEEFSQQYGTDFHFELAEGTESFTIPEEPEGVYEIAFEFNVQQTLTWWEYVYDEDAEVLDADVADGLFAVGFDGGYRFFFPDVMISIEESTS